MSAPGSPPGDWRPIAEADTAGLPGPIAADLLEASRCCTFGAHRGAALLARRAVEQVAVLRRVPLEMRTFHQKVAWLVEAGHVPRRLVPDARAVRDLGNAAAHGGAPVTMDEACAGVRSALAVATAALGTPPGGRRIDVFAQLDRAADEFQRRLALVGDADWARPTPCEGWDVRDLVNHVIGGARRYEMLLHGATAEEVDATRSQDHAGDDPRSSFARAAAAVRAAFAEPGALRRTVHHPAGDRGGDQLLEMRITEFAIHAWDLARAIGADERLDDKLVEAMWARMSRVGTRLPQGTYFSPAADSADEEPVQRRLLRLTGRRP